MFKFKLLTSLLEAAAKFSDKALDVVSRKVDAGLSVAGSQAMKSGSLIRQISNARIEPITVVDQNTVNYERIDDLLHFSLNTFSVIYAQGVALSNKLTVNGMSVNQRLRAVKPAGSNNDDYIPSLESELYKPNDAVIGSLLGDANELYKNGLPKAQDFISLESKAGKSEGTGKVDIKLDMRDSSVLSVGKIIDINLSEGDNKSSVTVPVSIRLATITIKNKVLVDAMRNRFNSGETALERKVRWKQGRLSLIKDILLCRDIRNKNFKDLISDQEGVRALNPNRFGDFTKSIAAGASTIAGSSSILIIDANTAREVEGLLGGKFDNTSFRQRMLEQTGVMIFCIVDQESDVVSIYFDTLPNSTDISGRNLSKIAKNDGPDLNQALVSMVTKQSLNLR